MPFPTNASFQFKQQRPQISDRYTYINKNLHAQQQQHPQQFGNHQLYQPQSSPNFMNRNKNPAYFFNRNNNIQQQQQQQQQTSHPFSPYQQNNPIQQQQQQIQQQKAKSAILSHLNLNNKAREELEKRKLKAKQEREEAAAKEAQAAQVTPVDHTTIDNTPAIPITSYSSYNNESDEDDEDDSNDEDANKNKNKNKKHKLDGEESADLAKKQKLSEKAALKPTRTFSDDDDEISENKNFFNVFSKLNKKKKNNLPWKKLQLSKPVNLP